MTDERARGTGGGEIMQYDDLDLLINYLNKRLDPERVAHVRRRLDEDPAFRDFAAPLIAAWEVPKHWKRHPRPAGEIERHWEAFTKRNNFVHQVQKRRRLRNRWIGGAGLLVLLGLLVSWPAIKAGYLNYRDYETVAADTGWVKLRDGTDVRLGAGTHLRSSKRRYRELQRLRLEGNGTVHVRAFPPDTSHNLIPEFQMVAIETPNAAVASNRGEFSVTVRGDTTFVDVYTPSKRAFTGFLPFPTTVTLGDLDDLTPLILMEGERGWLVKDAAPSKTPLTSNPKP